MSRTVKGELEVGAAVGVALGLPGTALIVGADKWNPWPVAPSAVVMVGQKKLNAPTTPERMKPSTTTRMLRTLGMRGWRREARRRRGASGERPRLMVARPPARARHSRHGRRRLRRGGHLQKPPPDEARHRSPRAGPKGRMIPEKRWGSSALISTGRGGPSRPVEA